MPAAAAYAAPGAWAGRRLREESVLRLVASQESRCGVRRNAPCRRRSPGYRRGAPEDRRQHSDLCERPGSALLDLPKWRADHCSSRDGCGRSLASNRRPEGAPPWLSPLRTSGRGRLAASTLPLSGFEANIGMRTWAIRLGKCESANQYARQLLLACETLARGASLKKASAERNGTRAMQQSVAQSRWMSS